MSTYTPIATQTLSSSAASITFSGIPQTYTDLVLISSGIYTSDGFIHQLTFNNDTGNNYSFTRLLGNGTAASSTRQSNIAYAFGGWAAINPSTNIVHIMNYSNTTTNKTVLTRGNFAAGATAAYVNLWRSTSAISEIDITLESGANYSAGSTFTLYGIGAGSPKAFGGDEVTTDGTYWYHTYRSSGIFAPVQDLACDYLVVAGGGGGGSRWGGGGGAGGLRCTVTATGGGGSLESALNLTKGSNYTVTVGAGGAGGAGAAYNRGTSGGNSVFATITSTGGGAGGTGNSQTPNTGGSGGAGGFLNQNGAAGTANQGYAGGNAATSGAYLGGGGGGAGAVGANPVNNTSAGNGGNGVATSITGTSVTYAGGGGGGAEAAQGDTAGTGGTGGGGNGSNTSGGTAGAGTANTGGGGGGGGNDSGTGGTGGSGIVVVRYAI